MSGRYLRNALRRERVWLATMQTRHPWVQPTDLRMMRRALDLARMAAAAGEVPVGAVIYREGEIVAEAANDREATRDPAGHAELVALRRAGERLGRWRLHDCRMAVTLEPCPMCAGALVNARLGGLVFGAFDPKAGAVGTACLAPAACWHRKRSAFCAVSLLREEGLGPAKPDNSDTVSSLFQVTRNRSTLRIRM
jgi:tRNA(adenine34) deaminase